MNSCQFKFGIFYLTHRIIIKLMFFSHKIFNEPDSPTELKKQFICNLNLNKGHELRNLNKLYQPMSIGFNSYGENDFIYFFSRFINKCYINNLYLNFSLFKTWAKNNVNVFFINFIKEFPKFNLEYKYISLFKP